MASGIILGQDVNQPLGFLVQWLLRNACLVLLFIVIGFYLKTTISFQWVHLK